MSTGTAHPTPPPASADALKNWIMVVLTLVFVGLYGAALIGWLKPLTDDLRKTELGQTLTAIKANLAALRSDNDRDAARAEDCNRLVDDAIHNVRELSQLLHPTILDDFGLDASLRWLAERFTQRTGIEIEYESNFNERLSDDTETHVFRIVQEALTNVARHSEATKVRIELERRDRRIHLSLVDNGKGLQDQPNATAGMGLTGMRARARGAGGELQIASRNGVGVSIELWAPLNNAKTGR